ncbi:MAG TPA: hypothetical protein VLE27_04790, partial [Thermoanaerobaculia bacterium]|nr:hypothetical protein [Thermoanaerobaculia bacterium]
MRYHQPIALRHQGKVVVFSRSLSAEAGIHFNVLDLQIDSERDEFDWTGFEPLQFPTALRPIGMSLFSAEMSVLGVKAEPVPFQAVSDQQHIYLYQQSSRKTLLVNRFLLVGSPRKSGSASGNVPAGTFRLEPAWEVRFQRSGKRDVSGGPKDTTAFTDPLGDPFVEPTLELPMVRNLEDGRFTVLILPTQKVDETRWQIFSYNTATKKIDAFSFRRTGDGLFDVSDRTAGTFLAPDQSISLKDAEIRSVPSALLYMKQEQIQAADGKEGKIRRYGRVLVALQALAKGASQEKMALLDLGIGTDGKLARVQDPTPVPLTDQADYALRFTAGAYVAMDPACTPTPTQSFTL